MQETAAKIASGDYGQRAAVEGPREIADVAHQFNAMLNAIEHSRLVQTEREAQIHHLAFYDVLTGLPNRRVLVQEIEQHLNASGQAERIGAVIYIDLDHFKDVNDAYGHQAGDRFLKEVADRIRAVLTGGDTLARIGGDEFVYVAGNVGTNQEAAAAAALKLGHQIQAVLQQPGGTDGYGSSTSASLGITLFPKVGDTSEILLHEADIAMYHVKKSGRSRVALFESSMRSQLTARIAMEVDLHSALKEGQFQLYIQSQVDHAGTVTGAEALLRWYHPRQEMISPAIFIPVAEESNLIVQIGNWVMREGCKAQVAAQIQYPRLPLSINVSPRQFRHPDFVENVREAIDQARADPSLLILEVTEGLLIDDVEGTIERMNELAKSGIRFSIDDFGTGYSSLAYLQRLPLYELKIDMSFIKDIPNDSNSTAIVQSIIGVAEHLGLHVVAEGVETRAQVAFLTASGCNALQGYLFARPIPLHEWLKKPVSSPAPNLG
jgi:diguanylate cyclase (GGDEF)-like protein